YTGLWVLEAYLDQRLFEVLRTDNGLTYEPSVSYDPTPDVGLFWIDAEVDLEDADETLSLIDEELDRIRNRTVERKALEQARDGLLMQYSQRFESNADVAEYYVSSLFELEAYGAFRDEEQMLKSLSVDAILDAGAKAFARDGMVSLRNRRFWFDELVAGS